MFDVQACRICHALVSIPADQDGPMLCPHCRTGVLGPGRYGPSPGTERTEPPAWAEPSLFARSGRVTDWFRQAIRHFPALLLPSLLCNCIVAVPLYLLLLPAPADVRPFWAAVLAWSMLPHIQPSLARLCLKRLRFQRWTVADLFVGLGRSGPLFALQGLVLGVGLICQIPLVTAAQFPETPLVLVIAAAVPGLLLHGWLMCRFVLFAPQVLADDFRYPTDVLEECWERTALGHGKILIVAGVLLLLNAAALPLYGVGLLLTLPFSQLVLSAAYLDLEPRAGFPEDDFPFPPYPGREKPSSEDIASEP
jgi:hypothetical protein